MGSSFFELSIASSGLFAAQTALSVTSNNISNANTEGYTKQVLKQQATTPMPTNNGKGMVGTGTEIVDVEQVRDLYLDEKYCNQTSKLGESNIKTEMLTKLQMLFNEPSDYGINASINNFFTSLEDLSTDTSEESYYNGVQEAASSLVNFFNESADTLNEYQSELNDEVSIKVNEINSLAAQIEGLNEQIFNFENDGSTANDLRDQRQLLVEKLSEIVNVQADEVEMNPEVKEGTYSKAEEMKSIKHFIVKINGQILVDHYNTNKLTVDSRDYKNNPEDINGMYDIEWKSGQKLELGNIGGELRGILDLRDGNNASVFSGEVNYLDPVTNQITVQMPSRSDIQSEGIIKIGLEEYEYSSYTYDKATDEITFKLSDITGINIGDDITISNEQDYKGMPYYKRKLNEFVRTFARAINEGKYPDDTDIKDVTGNINGYSYGGSTGNYLFAYEGTGKGTFTSYDNMTAENFTLSKEFDENASVIAISTTTNAGESANDLVNELIGIKDDADLFQEGKPLDFIASVIGELAVDAEYANNYKDMQTDVRSAITNQRLSISGVDLNEEMSNMVKFQAAYTAAAKMISIMNEIYEKAENMGA